jgi:hypothetical protein
MSKDVKRSAPLSLKRINGLVSVASLSISLGVKLLGGPALTRFLALVLAVGAFLYTARMLVQLLAGYGGYRNGQDADRKLAGLLLANAVLSVVWIADAVAFWRWPSPAGQLVASLALYPLVLLVACMTVDVLQLTKRPRGTEFLRSFQRVDRVRALARHSAPLRWLEKHVDPITPPTDTSSFVNRLAMVLLVVSLANAPAVMGGIVRDVQRYGHKSPSQLARVRSGAASASGSSKKVLTCKRRVSS